MGTMVLIALTLACLVFIAVSTDGYKMTWEEYFVLRGGISLHLGWLACANHVNLSILANVLDSTPETMFALAVVSVAVVLITSTIFALVMKSPDPIVCFVAAWALNGISAQLLDTEKLDDPERYNPHLWDRITIGGLQMATSYASLV